MGMDLAPINPSADAPRDEHNEPIWGHYNWLGWCWLITHLTEWNIPHPSLYGFNDGDEIPDAECKAIADALEAHLDELSPEHRKWTLPKIALWRTCGGYNQF